MAAAMATQPSHSFNHIKNQRINQDQDKSRKQSFDFPIIELINRINDHHDYFTTSSCSGRIVIFSNEEENLEKPVKKGFNWLLVSHEEIQWQSLVESVSKSVDSTVLKFEPFILHVRCSELQAAQNLMQVCVSSGFRNSGLTVGKKGNITLAVRSSTSFEVPLSQNGELLVSNKYIQYVVEIANKKMRENLNRIKRLEESLFKFLGDSKILNDIEDEHDKNYVNCENND